MFTVKTKHDHINKTGIYAVSEPVKRYRDVRLEVESMTEWFNEMNGNFPEPYKKAYAISHCQVADKPYDFFIVDKMFLNTMALDTTKEMNKTNYYFPAQAIFNAKIVKIPEKIERDVPNREVVADKDGNVSSKVTVKKGMVSNKISVPEACMSFPNRTKRDTERYYRIKVKYQIKAFWGFQTITEWVEGVKSHMFQHEIQHARGENMYFHN